MDIKEPLCLLLALLSVTVTRGQNTDSCPINSCLQPPRCGQLEQCLLVALKDGCNPQLISYGAFDAYKVCLFGPEGFCTLRPLTQCYDTHLLPYTGIELPESTGLDPTSMAGFIGVLLEEAGRTNPIQSACSIPVTKVQAMVQCVLKSVNMGQRYCDTAMPILTARFFARQNLKGAFETSRKELLQSLTDYSQKCSRVGEWSSWVNSYRPSQGNQSDFEFRTAETCGGKAPASVHCEVDESSSQLCQQANCNRPQTYQCTQRGLICRPEDQGSPTQRGSCPCCDYRVRYLCPIEDRITIYPTYGPQTGGINVTIVGAALPRIGVIIEFGDTEATLKAISADRVIAVAPPLRGDLGIFAEKPVSLYLRLPNGRRNLNVTFTYRRKAELVKVYGLKTVVSGGTNVTVEGENLLSLSQASMNIKVNYRNNRQLVTWDFRSACWVVSDTMVRCPVPALLDPIQFTPNTTRFTSSTFFNGNRRRRSPEANRDIDSISDADRADWVVEDQILQRTRRSKPPVGGLRSSHAGEKTFKENDASRSYIAGEDVDMSRKRRSVLHLTGRHPARRRHKRGVCDSQGGTPINVPNELWYEVTFDLDGEMMPGGNIDVYADPQIETFQEDPTCRILATWRIGNTPQLEIVGSRLNTGLSCNEYNVRVGKGKCQMEDLFSNRIICIPPDDEPESADVDPSNILGVEVKIGNGNLRFLVGCVRYESNFTQNKTVLYGVIGGLCAALVLIILIVICCCYCKKGGFTKV